MSETAYAAGHYDGQILPLTVKKPVFDDDGKQVFDQQGEEIIFSKDECIRAGTTLEKLASLNPLGMIVSYAERELLITAGNSCPTNDGAAAVLLMNEKTAKAKGLKPLVRIKSMAVSGVKPQLMGVGTIPASRKAIRRAGLTPQDIGLAEINEAFASQSLVTVRELGLDPKVVNVNGGAIAIGHPLGASGARLLIGLGFEMRRRGNVKYGLASMCIGAGMGTGTVGAAGAIEQAHRASARCAARSHAAASAPHVERAAVPHVPQDPTEHPPVILEGELDLVGGFPRRVMVPLAGVELQPARPERPDRAASIRFQHRPRSPPVVHLSVFQLFVDAQG